MIVGDYSLATLWLEHLNRVRLVTKIDLNMWSDRNQTLNCKVTKDEPQQLENNNYIRVIDFIKVFKIKKDTRLNNILFAAMVNF